MKFLTKPRKHLEVVVFLLSYFAFLAVLMNVLPKYLVWHALPESPEPIEKIYFVFGDEVTVMTKSNNRFICDIYNTKECWVEDHYKREEWVPQACGEISPNDHSVQAAQTCYFVHNYAGHITSFSLNDDGLIYVRQKGFVSPFGYFLGAVFAAFCTLLFFLWKVSISGIIYIFQEAYSLVRRHLSSKE